MSVTVTDAQDACRFEARAGDRLAGFADYRRTAELVVLPHTEVDPAFEGQGVGGTLARTALDDARRRGLQVRLTCPFMADWMTRHPEYQDLVEHDRGATQG